MPEQLFKVRRSQLESWKKSMHGPAVLELSSLLEAPTPLDLRQLPIELVDATGSSKGQPIDREMQAQEATAVVDVPDDLDMDNFSTVLDWAPAWLENTARNAGTVLADLDSRGLAANAHTFSASVSRPDLVAVLGSGYSLDDLAELLPAFPGLVLAGPSNASAASHAGRDPDGIVAIDAGFGTGMHLQGVNWLGRETKLISTPQIHPSVPPQFRAEQRLWFNSIVQFGSSAQHPLNIFLAMLFPGLISYQLQAGCAVNAELLLLHMLEVMAEKRLFKAVYLLGVDLAYQEERSRCRSWQEKNGSWLPYETNISRTSIQTRAKLWRSRNGLVTDEVMIGYKRSLLTVWDIGKLPLWDCSAGILTEIPKADFSSLGSSFDPPEAYLEDDEIRTRFHSYLAETGYQPGKFSGFEGRALGDSLWDGKI